MTKRPVKNCTVVLDNLEHKVKSAQNAYGNRPRFVFRGLNVRKNRINYGYPLFIVTDLTFTMANAKKKRTELWKSSICAARANSQ
jgi:hypothetical protein